MKKKRVEEIKKPDETKRAQRVSQKETCRFQNAPFAPLHDLQPWRCRRRKPHGVELSPTKAGNWRGYSER